MKKEANAKARIALNTVEIADSPETFLKESNRCATAMLRNPEIWSLLTDVDLVVIASSGSIAATALTYL